jgi:3'-phosphoadenosine 5'-phosphosulfate sulfotransferase (PAPS reductase)/FAD synthetase
LKVLQFSGGKDSLACLLYLQDQLKDITVLWTDSGDSFPETLNQMEAVKAICPNFVTVKGNQPEVIEEYGYPADVLPVRCHAGVQHLAQQERPKMQAFLDCCNRSLMAPMHEATKALGATMIIRGQKQCDAHKSPINNGDVIDGVAYWFPLDGWTDEQVIDYVKESSLLPAHYEQARTSMDCMHCTAYLAENQWKLPYLKRHYPEQGAEVEKRLKIIRHEVDKDMAHLYGVL